MALLTFDARFKHASGFEIDAAFEVGGGVTALFGPSGSGKSTILHLIAGLLRPIEGSIRLGGRTLVETKAGIHLRPEQRRVGMVFQDHLLFPHMSVRKNLLFGMNRDGGRRISFDRVVNTLALGDVLDRTPKTLSGGQAQHMRRWPSAASRPGIVVARRTARGARSKAQGPQPCVPQRNRKGIRNPHAVRGA